MTTASTPVCVIGAGTMGRGIAQVALTAGHLVTLVDPAQEQLDSATAEVESRLARKAPEIADSLSERLTTVTSIDAAPVRPGTLVVEAVLESLQVKGAVLTAAYEHYGPDAVLATNTSSLSITEIATATPAPDRVVGMHFFNPVPVMQLVEVVTGLQTGPDVADLVAELAVAWGKQVARVRSAPGFIVNRVARAFYGEPLRLVEEQVAGPRVLDEVVRTAGGFRMGPFELMDLIGNDVNAAVTRSVWTAFHHDPRFQPSRVQDELVSAGRYGRKRGHGFFPYGQDVPREALTPVVPGEAPAAVELSGSDGQLSQLLARTDVIVTTGDGEGVLLPDGTLVLVTRGRSARAESAARAGVPVVLLDRCLTPGTATGLAVATSHPAALPAVAALLQPAGVALHEVADAPGLVLARTLAMIANEAFETVLHDVAGREDVDVAMRLGTNYPVGPFAWTEQWGPAAVVELLDELHDTYRDPRYRASRLLREDAAATM
ncbi:3-hydroxyacyl-CoA dehydrogenase [Modestobacter sp. Leaf380]|uniref:3-hydroxyacyl-CoA dehydrogenase n=1 Tax=Modestobacter sp. Leaf380 TaxID=1736356 RepID=UPI0006F38C4D|nr:3-hydroxyacyl-CoA dehydrogenase [Modestobacter sp. Leaf380]KQS68267.1 3-hydroxyacyl-CoA dehydrogenase [Modestobacter sp. Leaf380]